MPSKKKSKGVLERIGNAATSAAEVVINAGSKAMHAVGDMMPSGSTPKGAKASSKAGKAKTSKSGPKAMAKASKSREGAGEEKNGSTLDQENAVEESSARLDPRSPHALLSESDHGRRRRS